MKTRNFLKRVLEDPRHGPDSPLAAALQEQIGLEEDWAAEAAERRKRKSPAGEIAPPRRPVKTPP